MGLRAERIGQARRDRLEAAGIVGQVLGAGLDFPQTVGSDHLHRVGDLLNLVYGCDFALETSSVFHS